MALAFAGPVHLGGAILQSSSPCPIIQGPSLPQRGKVDPWLLRLPRPQEAAASICCSLWEGVLVGALDTPLQAFWERSSLLRRQSLCAPVTPLLPGSTTEGRLPCKYTRSPHGSKSGNTPTRLPFWSKSCRATAVRLTSLPRVGGGAISPEVTSWTKPAQLDKLRSDRSFGKPPGGGPPF